MPWLPPLPPYCGSFCLTLVVLITHFLAEFGYDWNHAQNSGQAMFLVVFASVWKQISYNFLFFYAALQSIPRSLIEAAAIDGAADSPLL